MRHNAMRKKVEEGKIVSVNGTRSEISTQKWEKRGHKLSNWFLKGEVGSVITCQPKPGSSIKKLKINLINDSLKKDFDNKMNFPFGNHLKIW